MWYDSGVGRIMKISVTDLQTYKRCRRMWKYSSSLNRNLTRIGMAPSALELGGLVHRALAAWILEPEESLPLLFMRESGRRKKEIEDKYEEVNGYKIHEDELDLYLDLMGLGLKMMTNYQEYHKTPIPDNMGFAAAEQEIEVPIPGTNHICEKCNGTGRLYCSDGCLCEGKECDECNGKGITYHYLTATLDGLVRDNKVRLFVLEHKTYHPSYAPSELSLDMNQQFTRYAWVVSQLGLGPCAGILYDGMAKKEKPARGKELDSLFIRKPILKGPEELEQTGIDVRNEVMEIASGPAIYPNVHWQGCGDCSFTDLCRMESRGEDPELYIKYNFTQRETIRVQGIRD